jgi:hypothetical protein
MKLNRRQFVSGSLFKLVILGIGPIIYEFCGSMPVNCKVHLVLDCFEEVLRGFGPGVIIDAEGINFQYLAVEDLLRGADVTDTSKEFVVKGKALDEIFFECPGCPHPELDTAQAVYPIAYADNHVQVIVLYVATYIPQTFLLNCCKKCNS